MANSKFSNFVFNVIDLAGINDHIKIRRIGFMKQAEWFASEYSKHSFNIHDVIFTGSTSEGTLHVSQASDLDAMIVQNGIICVDDANTDASGNFDILIAQYENMPPGYIKVRHTVRGSNQHVVVAAMLSLKSHWYGSTGGAPFISNEFLKTVMLLVDTDKLHEASSFVSTSFHHIRINGPAFTSTLQVTAGFSGSMISFESDVVNAIPFYNSSILKDWSQRNKFYDWPSEELIQDVSAMEGYITPVGEKESENEHVEWRISHVTAEKKLVQSFNSTQYKLYVVLKLFSKQVFTSVSQSFSSYMVKNIVLWMAEINPSRHFTPALFIAQLLQSLNFIKQCLICNHLPSYMIPKKNLIARRIRGHEKRELIKLLSSLTDEGACVVYRLPKLATCLNYASLNLSLFSKVGIWRHCVEAEFLSLECEILSSLDPVTDDLSNICNGCIKKIFQDQRLLRKTLMLFYLLVPNYLDRVPQSEMLSLCFKRLQLVHECLLI